MNTRPIWNGEIHRAALHEDLQFVSASDILNATLDQRLTNKYLLEQFFELSHDYQSS